MTFVLVRLASLEQLAEVQPTRLEVDMLIADFLDEGWRSSLVGRYYYVDVDEDGNEKEKENEVGSGGGGKKDEGVAYLRTRMMGEGIEDPATGSAASALSAYLALTREKASTAFRITQGVEMGRRSVISVETTVVKEGEDESGKVSRILDVYVEKLPWYDSIVLSVEALFSFNTTMNEYLCSQNLSI
jgi:hypothetical protein